MNALNSANLGLDLCASHDEGRVILWQRLFEIALPSYIHLFFAASIIMHNTIIRMNVCPRTLMNERGCHDPFPCSPSTTTATFTCNSTSVGSGMCTSSTATQPLNRVHMIQDPSLCPAHCDSTAECYAISLAYNPGGMYCIEYLTDEVDGTDGEPSFECYKKCTALAVNRYAYTSSSTYTSSGTGSTFPTAAAKYHGPPLNPTVMCRGSSFLHV